MKRLFGTDGIRGVAGEFPLDPATVDRIGRALAASLRTDESRPPRLLIGRDTRESGPAIEEALARSIREAGGRADRGGVLTTPAIACLTRLLGYDAGVVVSASHNPYRDNGIKVFSGRGYKLLDAEEAAIERQVLEGERASSGAAPSTPGREAPGRPAAAPEDRGAPEVDPAALAARYLDWLRDSIAADASFSGWRIVLDCANGAAFRLGPDLFRRLGAEVIALSSRPDGRNINEECGALHPQRLAEEVVKRRARIGLAFDGDADRCLCVDSSGRILTGDHVLYLAAKDLKAGGGLAGGAVVGTVMSNLWLDQALGAEGIALLRAQVGDKYVLEEMQRGGHPLGGEPSGHIIFLDRATTGDGLLTGLLFIDLLRRTGQDLAAWAATVRPCPQVLVNVAVRRRPPLHTHPTIGPAIKDEARRLGRKGRLLVRYSGTEPQARIMVEAESEATVQEIADRLKTVIQREIGRDR
jgi:phosphoglucosamine mutase